MQIPLQVTFQGMEHSPALEARLREAVDKLEKYCGEIVGCRVSVEAPHRHHESGRVFHVHVEVTVPGQTLVANREPELHHAYTDVYVAVRDAFDTMRRLLEEYVRKRRRAVKTHDVPQHGRIIELDVDGGFGRIETPDGGRVYFHRNAVVGDQFRELSVGDGVRFDEEMGDDGPQASTVHLLGKHHIVT